MPLVQQLFLKIASKEVREVPLNNRSDYSGKEIRKRMIMGKEWKDLVPSEVVELIEMHQGIERIQEVSKSDESEEIDHNER